MGKNLIQQRRGKGSPTYRAPSFRYKGKAKHANYDIKVTGKIIDILHSSGHSAPLMKVAFGDGKETLLQAPEGIRVGDEISIGDVTELKSGNVMALGNIPEGTAVYNIEHSPGDGGKFVRSSGASAKVFSKSVDKVVVILPSSKKKEFRADCKAVIGSIAGGGRTDKPVLKAGNKYHAMRAKNKLWPSVSGTSMNSVDHPFGGSSSGHKGRPTQSSRHAPPGRKVGKIAPRRTGRRK